MYKKAMWLLLLAISPYIFADASVSGQQLLMKLDQLRIGLDQARVLSRVELYKDGALKSSREYLVYVGSDRKSLALFQSPEEKGQKVLMLDDQFWIFMPRSKRPIRITPMQKLLGEASAGDIASLRWHEDYQGDEVLLTDRGLEADFLAARKGLSYARVHLLADPQTLEPISAQLYLNSGKLAKTALFEIETRDGQRFIQAMELRDQIQVKQKTRIIYLSAEAMVIPEKWFNPSFLVRNPGL